MRRVALLIVGALLLSGSGHAFLPVTLDRVVVFKAERKLIAVKDGRVVKTYRVALGQKPLGTKRCRGDNRTPEGEYHVTRRVPDSRYFLALHLSYPSPEDAVLARNAGCDPGGSIEIHGLAPEFGWMGRRHLERDWTNGCIAVTNEEMQELYRSVAVGTPVEIYP
ncbi:MAG TPA: L,D-transpeptidase family protein [Steroidobacteraceae bacterium]|nr:L,D-transpeptidase family protein [Steroidobacteraceae bacterium]